MDRYLASYEIPFQVKKCLAVWKCWGLYHHCMNPLKLGSYVTCLCVNNQKYFLIQPSELKLCWKNASNLCCTMDFGDHISNGQISVFLRGNHSNLHILLLMAKAASFSPWDCSSSVVFLWLVHLDIDWNRTCSRTIDSCQKSEKFWLQSC